MKKIIALLLVLAMAIGLIACGNNSDAAADTTAQTQTPANNDATDTAGDTAAKPYEGQTISFWIPPYTGEDQSYWDERLAAFEEETGCTVEVSIVPWGDMSTKYMAGFMSGEGPDVFYMTNELMYDMVDAGACLELSPYFTDEEIADQLYWSAGYQLGGQYAAPFSAGVSFRGVTYNMDLLEAAGVTEVPTTWDQVVAAGQKIKDAGVCEYSVLYPMAGDNASLLVSFFPTLWSAGGDLVNSDGTEVTLNTPEALAAMQYLYDLTYTYEILSKDCTGIDGTAALELFKEGKVAICFLEPGYVMTVDLPFNWTAALGVSDGTHDLKTFSPVDTMSVNANSENIDASIALLKFLISVDQRDNFRQTNYPTLAKMNAAAADISYEPAFINDCMAQVSTSANTMPVCKGVSTMTEAIGTNLQLMMMGELTPAEALEAMQNACTIALEG